MDESVDAIPDFQTMGWNVLKSFEGGGVLSPEEVRQSVRQQLALSDEQVSRRTKSGSTIFANRVAWAMVRLDEARLTEKTGRALRRITDRGRQVLAQGPLRLDEAYLRQFPEFEATVLRWRSGRKTSHVAYDQGDSPDVISRTPQEDLRASLDAANAVLSDQLLEKLRAAHWSFFEGVVLDVLAKLGYGGGKREWSERIGQPGDGGVDGIIREDALGLDMIYVQAKRYGEDNIVGRPALQQFAGTLDMKHAKRGVFITTSSFADTAVDFVKAIEKRIALIDGADLVEIMIEHDVGVRPVESFILKDIDENYFEA